MSRHSTPSRLSTFTSRRIPRPSRLVLTTAAATVAAAGIAAAALTIPGSSPSPSLADAAVRQHAPAVSPAPAEVVLRLALTATPSPSPTTPSPTAKPAPTAKAAPPKPAPPPPSPIETQAPAPAPAPAVTAAAPGTAQAIAQNLLASYGWSASQFSCLEPLWERESGWNVYAENPDGAYGIPQAYPGSKMASAGADWRTDATTQIKWGLSYIASRYGSPCAAWDHEEADGSY